MLKSLQVGYKARETRYPVLIQARMHAGASWTDVVIHNLSAHGALVACDDAPDRGTYIDIRRGQQTIVGRVIWRKDRFFGIRAQESIDIAVITNEPRLTRRPAASKDSDVSQPDRRAQARMNSDAEVARQLERSRRWSSAFQFILFVAAGLFAAGFAATYIFEALSRPFSVVEKRL